MSSGLLRDALPEIPDFLRRRKASEECLLCTKECSGAWKDCPQRRKQWLTQPT